MTKQKGFTLIELVVVIIILGILAVTAAPKFLDLSGDARESTLQGMKAALEGAATLTYSKAAIQGVEKSATSICVEVEPGDDCAATPPVGLNTLYGYPLATEADLEKVLEIDFCTDKATNCGSSEWHISPGTNQATISLANYNGANCELVYNEASSARPVITVTATGC